MKKKEFHNSKTTRNNKKYIILSIVSFALILYLGGEYLKIENNTRLIRMENQGIIINADELDIDDIILFNQQKELLKYIRTQATPNMRSEQVDWMQKVSERYGYAPALFRYALAAGLNNRAKEVQSILQRICKTSSKINCREMQENWEIMRIKYPELPKYID